MSVGHGGLYHSQSPEGYFLGASGLKVGLSSSMGLRVINLLFRLLSLVRRFKPRVFSLAQSETLIPCFLWSRRFSTVLQVSPVAHELQFIPSHKCFVVEQVPVDDYELPLGSAEVLSRGSDLTLLSWGTPLYHCETALSLLSSPSSVNWHALTHSYTCIFAYAHKVKLCTSMNNIKLHARHEEEEDYDDEREAPL